MQQVATLTGVEGSGEMRGVAAQAAARGRLGRNTTNCADARACTWLAMTWATMSAGEAHSLALAPAEPVPWLSKDQIVVACPQKP